MSRQRRSDTTCQFDKVEDFSSSSLGYIGSKSTSAPKPPVAPTWGKVPLNRIITVDDAGDGLVVCTTDIHLPRRIGEALKRAYRGTLDTYFDDDGYFARVDWYSEG